MDYPTKDEMNAAIAGLQARVDARPTKDEMNAAIAGLEARMDARMDALRNELSAKIEKGISEMIKWVVGLAFAGAMAIVTLMTYTLNNATPKAAPPAPAAQAPVPSVVIMEAPRAQ